MSHQDCRAELREKTHQLLHGALKHVRVAALATALVPLGALAAHPAVAQDCGSGGCPEETPTVAATDTPTDTPPHTATMTFTWTPVDTPTETPTHTELPTHTETPTVAVPDTPTDTPTETATETATNTTTITATPTDAAMATATHTATATRTSLASRTPTATQLPTATGTPCPASSIRAKFNRTAIARNNCIWFSGVFNPSKLGAGPTTIVVENQTVQFTANGQLFTVSVPRAVVTFDANVTNATTTFDTVGSQWVTEVPLHFDRNVFMAGVMFPVAGHLPGGIKPVTWSGSFFSDADRLKVEWEWGAAVYTKCDRGLDALGVKPVDGNARNPYRNSDDAGTPETIKRFVIGGARGDGGSNYTGSHSRTKSVRPCD